MVSNGNDERSEDCYSLYILVIGIIATTLFIHIVQPNQPAKTTILVLEKKHAIKGKENLIEPIWENLKEIANTRG